MSVLNKELYELFKNPRHETVQDVIAVGGVLEPEILKHAYQNGIFPWPHEGYPLLWFAPEQRGVIDFSELHIPRSFKKWLKKNESSYQIKLNTCFAEVVKQCKIQKRQGQKGSWINKDIQWAYQALFDQGHAFSLEVFRDSKLVAGLYGVQSEFYYSCESMFHLEDNTSKLALYKWIEKIKKERHTWVDIQMVTSVCESFGGKLISKEEFLQKIKV